MVLDDFDDQMIAGDECRLNFLTLVMQLRKKSQPRNLPDRGSNPGPLHERRACCHLAHSGGPGS